MSLNFKVFTFLVLIAFLISGCSSAPDTPSKEDVVAALGAEDVGILEYMYKISYGDENCFQKSDYEYRCEIWQSIEARQSSEVDFDMDKIQKMMAENGVELNKQESAAAAMLLAPMQLAFWGCSGSSFSMEIDKGTQLNLRHIVTFNLQDNNWLATKTQNDNFSCG
jgi:hypothetical protein